MTDKDILENNELIAVWMGVKEEQDFYDSYSKNEPYWFTTNRIYRTDSRSLPDLSFADFVENSRYHVSWDWLMPVVEKVDDMDDGKYIITIEPMITIISNQGEAPIVECSFGSRIENTYKAVVEFIKWWNNTQKK